MLVKLYILNWNDHFVKVGHVCHLQILITQNQLEVSKGRDRTGAHVGCSQDLEDTSWTTQVPFPSGSGTRGRQNISRKQFQSVGPLREWNLGHRPYQPRYNNGTGPGILII